MKKISGKLIISTSLLFLFCAVLGVFAFDLFGNFVSNNWGSLWVQTTGTALGHFIYIPFGLVCGFWLWNCAKQEKSNAVIWFVFGFFFHILAIAVYYGVTILRKLEDEIG